MRLTPIALSVALVVGTMASAGHGQRPDDQINPRSMALVQYGQSLSAAGQYNAAIDALESALAVDPRNREAYVELARVAQGQRLPGKAIRFYVEALRIEPNDVNALMGHGEALVQRGAVDRARQNLARIQNLCRGPCPQADRLAQAISVGPPAEVLTAQVPESGPPSEN